MRITKDPELRRQEIIESARALFEEKGIRRTSMSEIAKKIGVAKGLIYYYFASKEQLVREVIEELVKDIDEKLDEIIQGKGNFFARLRAVLDYYFNSIAEHPTLQEMSPVHPDMFVLLKERLYERANHHALKLVREGIDAGILHLRYPEYMVKIIIRGLGDLYIDGVTDSRIHIELVEQLLGLDKGILLNAAPKP